VRESQNVHLEFGILVWRLERARNGRSDWESLNTMLGAVADLVKL